MSHDIDLIFEIEISIHNQFISVPQQMDLLETNNQLKTVHQQLTAAQQSGATKGGIDEAQRKEIESQLIQMEEFKKQLDNQAKAIESERKLFEEQRYFHLMQLKSRIQ